jgi:hypothetical protein
MKHLRNIRRAALLVAALVLLFAASATAAAATTGSGTAASGTAWIRLAHLSPDTPAVDVYAAGYGPPCSARWTGWSRTRR